MTTSIQLDHETKATLRQRLREQSIPLSDSDFVRSAIQEDANKPHMNWGEASSAATAAARRTAANAAKPS